MTERRYERKHEKKDKNRRRFAWFFKLLAAVTLLGAIVVGATVFFKVEQVEVVGNVHYTPKELVVTSGILKGDNLFGLPLDAIEKTMEGELPYLEQVKASRRLPNGILLTVQEWDAVAYVETYSGNWLISVGGKILEKGEGADKICISGLDVLLPTPGSFVALGEEEKERQNSIIDLLEQLEQHQMMELVSTIDMSDTTIITMTYDDRFQVILPMNGDYDYELQVLEAAIPYHTDQERGTFDLTQQDYEAVFQPENVN